MQCLCFCGEKAEAATGDTPRPALHVFYGCIEIGLSNIILSTRSDIILFYLEV